MEFLKEIVFAIVGVVVPIIATYVCKWLQSLYENNKSKIKNETVKNTLGQVTDLISSAVKTTTSTYVKELKKDNLFDAGAQKEAFEKTADVVKKQLTADSTAVIEQTYGNIDEYIRNQIEKFVEEQK